MRTIHVAEPGGTLDLVEVDRPEPGRGHVRIAVEACGICHSDLIFVNGLAPDITFPLVPGHEIAGRIDALGDGVEQWQLGDRVAVGWFGGNCGLCRPCRAGDFIHCERLQVPSWAYPGGYAESVVVPVSALARIPDELSAVEAAPMACAGVTTFNGLRRSGAQAGDLVAVLGVGGLGHLAVQFATKLGFETVAIARGTSKEDMARRLGAHHYIDSASDDVSGRLRALGGARVVLATATSSEAMSATIDGLGTSGELVVVGAPADALRVSPQQLIFQSKSLRGHPSGTAYEVEETLRFAALTGVRAWIEPRPLAEAAAAYDRMLSGEARFRVVLTAER